MKRLLAFLIILCLAGCEDDYGTTVDNSDGFGSDTWNSETGEGIQAETETEERRKADTETGTETETETEIPEPAAPNTGSTIPELETETETETETEAQKETADTETESESDTAAVLSDCEMTIYWADQCWGVGSQYHHIKDSCNLNMFDSWALCLIECRDVSDCKQFLLCEGKC